MRQFEEGLLAVPPKWHDATVNVYTAEPAGIPGVSVTVNRDKLPLGSTLEDYVDAQSQVLAKQLRQFRLIGREKIALMGMPAHLLEFTWNSQDVGKVHQMLVTLLVGTKVINLAATSPGSMSDSRRAELRAILESFRPTLITSE